MNGLVLEALRKLTRGEVRLQEPMARHTSLRIGGPADVFVVPRDKEDSAQIVEWLQSRAIPHFILGRGTNILVGDAGIRGVVVAIQDSLEYLHIEGARVTVGAGYSLPKLVLECLRRGLGGIEGLGGVPGSVGGAVIMNAGAYGVELFDYLLHVELIQEGRRQIRRREQVRYGYRYTDLRGALVLEAVLELPAVDPEQALRRRQELLARRNATQPLELPNAGSVFKNPPGEYAGRLIEAAGLKGFRIGGAMVSDKHANFLVNTGSATAQDMRRLIEHVRQVVQERFGVELELEIELVGEGF
ncbi:MAG: UDP-N-acetylmuramate dehydrogenase [Bacteroidetes bacterium]|nr:UDP-N-acetylmuramate dehydrogenase [Rhodothermia bacterium]MCS7155870.1 UDP-N-acetylmuramate dehydrogenase [Bacteroidota bacterium]MCX7906029.1 UDP-N-acetylmuramate dehydrogenase [Bacteroidota bacterium]MDW8138157.1 UDP-N-acetylmuramate dehydrogenase [Bacteroidota bacterium]MDW8285841.1 UDP-N-acetylmuramate dehydrogenase [Bacteroidota bacterium]